MNHEGYATCGRLPTSQRKVVIGLTGSPHSDGGFVRRTVRIAVAFIAMEGVDVRRKRRSQRKQLSSHDQIDFRVTNDASIRTTADLSILSD